MGLGINLFTIIYFIVVFKNCSIEAVILDFDGVIVESVEIKTNAFAELYRPFGSGIVRQVIDHHQNNGGISRYEKIRYYHHQFLGIELTELELADWASKFAQHVITQVIEAPYVLGAYEFIIQHYRNYQLFISSGTPEDELKTIIHARQLAPYFDAILGAPDNKFSHLSWILKTYQILPQNIVFVGDATTDRDSAIQHHIHFIARVTDQGSLLSSEPYQIRDLTELSEAIDRLPLLP